jgi:hypothetical protein
MSGAIIETPDDTIFYKEGYHVHNLGLTAQTLEGLKKKAWDAKAEPIFNQQIVPDENEEALVNDRKRKMSKPVTKTVIKKDAKMKDLWKKLEVIAKMHNRAWKPFKLVVLRSEAGCMKQETHIDGIVGNPDIGGVLIAVEDKTFLDINGRTLELNAGDAVSYHGNTPHNGAAYKQENVRYHVYFARKEADILEGQVGKFAGTCEKCATGFKTINQRKYHRCRNDPVKLAMMRAGDNRRKRKQRAITKKWKKWKAEGVLYDTKGSSDGTESI